MIKAIDELTSKKKSGLLAAVLNILIPGTGYMYCGRIILGIIALLFVILVLMRSSLLMVFLVWVILGIDGFLAAARANKENNQKIITAMKTCPMCAEKVMPEAVVCKHCGSDFSNLTTN